MSKIFLFEDTTHILQLLGNWVVRIFGPGQLSPRARLSGPNCVGPDYPDPIYLQPFFLLRFWKNYESPWHRGECCAEVSFVLRKVGSWLVPGFVIFQNLLGEDSTHEKSQKFQWHQHWLMKITVNKQVVISNCQNGRSENYTKVITWRRHLFHPELQKRANRANQLVLFFSGRC